MNKPNQLSLFSDEEMGVQPGYIKPGNRQPTYPLDHMVTYTRLSDGKQCYHPVTYKPFEVYIQQARAIWGDRYDYSNSVYTNNKAPINIYCPKHDYEFRVSIAQNHVLKRNGAFKPTGCPICRAEETHHREFGKDWRKYLKLCAKQNRVGLIQNVGYWASTPEELERKRAERKAKTEEKRRLREEQKRLEKEQRQREYQEKLRLQKEETQRRKAEREAIRKAEAQERMQQREAQRLAELQQRFRREARKAQGPGYHYRGIKKIKNKESRVLVHCPNPEHKWHPMRVDLILQGCKCRECAGRHQPVEERCKTFINKCLKKYGPNHYDYSRVHEDYVNNDSPVWIKCLIHNEWFQTSPDNNLRTVAGSCPICAIEMNESEGEAEIRRWLNDHHFSFEQEFNIPNENPLCKRQYLRVDFWIPDRNLFIEYNGEQHYSEIDHFHDNDWSFEDQQIRDQTLRDYCKNHSINLLEIPYTKLKNIPNILKKTLKS